jgi:hypothetical protein
MFKPQARLVTNRPYSLVCVT